MTTATLRIGRGTNADLRSENPAVAFEHAVIEEDASGYTIADRGSITGTYVNGKPVESAQLGKGDLIEIGDLRIEVQLAEPSKPMFLRLARARGGAAEAAVAGDDEPAAAPGAGVVTAPRIDYAAAFSLHRSYLTKTTIAAILLILTLGVVGEVTKESNQRAFMPGGLSSAHSRARDASGASIADRCSACHAPFRAVADQSCQACHNQSPHSRTAAAAEPACASCHVEHRGEARLAVVAEGRCVGCHARANPSITSFGPSHPEFAPPPDINTLRFNHQLHLRPTGLPDATGRRTLLECAACHKMVESDGAAEPARISFDAHCRDCHRLTFDPRLPRAEVPHGGDPGLVYGFIMAMYAGNQDVIGKSPVELRRILTTRAATSPDQRAILNAEQVLKTKCRACHEISQQGERLAVTPPAIRTEWFGRTHFSHARHSQIACTDCHRGAKESAATADVLLPSKSDCTACHGAGTTQAASTCVTCHDYHQRAREDAPLIAAGSLAGLTPIDPDRMWGGRMFEMILIALVVVLLFVVLIPMGMALYQRMKPAPPPVAPRQQAPRAPAAPASTPPPPSAPAPAATQMIPIDGMQPSEPAGTQMMQWHGMLQCTAGPLEGQHFIIDDDGFYIGRDPALSKVVINDSRISKRHVRIVPRSGRVFAVDEGSTNGTFLSEPGGDRITEVQLRRGDKIVLADNAATFVYQI